MNSILLYIREKHKREASMDQHPISCPSIRTKQLNSAGQMSAELPVLLLFSAIHRSFRVSNNSNQDDKELT
jgi:hypothetical protein